MVTTVRLTLPVVCLCTSVHDVGFLADRVGSWYDGCQINYLICIIWSPDYESAHKKKTSSKRTENFNLCPQIYVHEAMWIWLRQLCSKCSAFASNSVILINIPKHEATHFVSQNLANWCTNINRNPIWKGLQEGNDHWGHLGHHNGCN